MLTNEKKNKHMTLDDRIEIQEYLCKGMTFKDIAKRIENINGKSAHDMSASSYSSELANALGISLVEPKDVIQPPKLFK